MRNNKSGRLRRLAVLTGGLLVGSVMYAVPALAADCTAAAGTAETNFKRGVAPAADCDTVTVTGSGAIAFDLSGGDFVSTSGNEVVFKLSLTGNTSTITVNGSESRDRVEMGTAGMLFGPGGGKVVVLDKSNIANTVAAVTVNGLGGGDDIGAEGHLGTGDDMTMKVTLNGGDGSDFLNGGAAADELNGDAGKDFLDGGGGNDAENGGAGADIFSQDTAANGGDTIEGDTGKDRIDYSRRTTPVSLTLDGDANDGAATFVAGTGGWQLGASGSVSPTWTATEGDDVTGVERLDGGSANDKLEGTTATARLFIDGNDGDDYLVGSPQGDNIQGDEGSDFIQGGAARDVIDGGDGNDFEFGGAGNDIFNQGSSSNGGDTLNGDDGTDLVKYAGRSNAVTVTVGAGSSNDGESSEGDDVLNMERVSGGKSGDTLTAAALKSVLVGNGGADTLNGGSQDDRLLGGAGDDTIKGNDGDDKMFAGTGNDDLTGGAGKDLGVGGRGTDTCSADTEVKRGCEN